MIPLIAGVILAGIILIKLTFPFFSSIHIWVFVNIWFAWLFAIPFIILVYYATRKVWLSILLTAVVTLFLRLVVK